jgi:hypothetical protein
MGLFEHPSLPAALTMRLDAGDMVLLLSDGVYEYANATVRNSAWTACCGS